MRGRILISLGIFLIFLLTLTAFVSGDKGPQEGQLAPEISLPTPAGDTMKLSSLKGHMVLVHFWASWCKSCREQSQKIVKLYAVYKDKQFKTGTGLIVLDVSLDENKQDWVEAINQDGFSMNYNVSDLKRWKSCAATTYKISFVPDNYLIDGNGKIIADGLIINYLDDMLKDELVKRK